MKGLYSIGSVGLVAAALAVSSTSSLAASGLRIAYGDLDLTRATGVEIFDSRIEAAADRLCRHERQTGTLISDRARCRAAVRAEAVAALPHQARADYAAARATTDY